VREDPLQQALALVRAGQLPQADVVCRDILGHSPGDFNALQLLGNIALQRQDYTQADRWLTAAIAVKPASAMVYSNLAVALLALGRTEEALDCCNTATALQPDFPQALANQGRALAALGRHAEALASYDRAIAGAPAFYDAHAGRTRVLLALERFSAALASSDRALQLAPASAEAWCNRGSALLKLKRPEESLAAFDQALALAPDLPEALNNRGTALRDLGRLQEAIDSYELALRLRADFAEAFCNLANIAIDTARPEDAIRLCDRALQIKPDMPEALNSRGTALRVLKRHEEATRTYERLLELSPRFGHAPSHLLFVRNSLCDWTDRDCQVASIVGRVCVGESVCTPHIFLAISDSAAAQLQCSRTFVADHFPPVPPLWRGEQYVHRRIRVAYLSADFSDHPVAHLFAGVLERHDRARFETIGISLRREAEPDPMRRRMQRALEHFHDVTGFTDREVARSLRDMEIDIAVDLTAHTSDGRLGILAFRPAPVQVHYLGFAGSSGASFIDYMIADAVTVSPADEQFYCERIVRLPHSFLPNDDRQPIAANTPARRDLGLPDDAFVFCAMHNPYKVTPATFDVWMQLLREVPGSVLWLRSGETALAANLTREATARGVAPERLVFASRVAGMDAHLARYRQADLFLDTVPYGGHATARDALWAGLPVLTCTGNSLASRVAASLLHALDLPELVTTNLEDYAKRALALAHSPLQLSALRARLAQQRLTGPLFDTDCYRQHLEAAYLDMWSRAGRKHPPASFDVPAMHRQ
jgi:protein O-GlcNAc transferase